MKRLFIFLLFYVFSNGQSNYFFSSYGASGGSEEMEAVIPTSDGKMVITGAIDFGSNKDLLLVKTDLNGNLLWAKSYGGNSDDMGIDVKETWDGGYIVAGWTQSYGQGSFDFWVLKTDVNGNLQWQKTYGGTGAEQAWSVSIDNKTFLIVGGTTSFGAGLSDVLVINIDSLGGIIWQKTYGTSGDDAPPGNYTEYVARGIKDVNGKFLLSGITDGTGSGGLDIFLIKVNPLNGNIIWQKTYGDTDDEGSWNFTEASGEYYLTGNYTDPTTFESDCWIVKTDSTGNILWQKTFGIGNAWDEILNVSVSQDGGLLLASYYEIGTNDWASLGFKVSASGSLQWANSYKQRHLDWFNALTSLQDNSVIFLGVSTDTTLWSDDMILIHTDTSGNISNCNLINPVNLNVANTNITPQNANFTTTTPAISPLNSTATANNVTLQTSVHCSQTVGLEYKKNKPEIFYANSLLKIFFENTYPEVTLTIYDIAGKKLVEKNYNNIREITCPVQFPQGMYILRIVTPQGYYHYKINEIK